MQSKIDGVSLKKLNVITDDRGWLMEMFRSDDSFFKKFGQTYVSATRPGVVKAFHFHEKQYDQFVVVSGTIRLVLYDRANEIVENYYLGDTNPLLVSIPPLIYHGWKNISTNVSLVVNVSSEVYDYKNPDEIRAPAHGFVSPQHNFTWDTIDR